MMIRALLRKQLRELGAAFLRSSKTGKARSRPAGAAACYVNPDPK